MSYHDLSSCTLNADERREEADRLLKIIDYDACSQREKSFLEQVQDGIPISVKQLFWLRDIKDKLN